MLSTYTEEEITVDEDFESFMAGSTCNSVTIEEGIQPPEEVEVDNNIYLCQIATSSHYVTSDRERADDLIKFDGHKEIEYEDFDCDNAWDLDENCEF